ncbi:hypothetical protein U27_03209 [Candidatus Vecturithrix granuli]|uniref:Lipoprotein n=1 Tax=Vecturithrix granuli TaxID=1499967 RepID=A0A081BV92_VECG1|nr:hypothetical protein U27_03209 [Candidatus Vecturithrix granuli]
MVSTYRALKRMGYWALLVSVPFILNGCIAAVPVAIVGGTNLYNAARVQYPDIKFEEPAPLTVTYQESQEVVWNAVVSSLQELNEQVSFIDKTSGIIRTEPRNFNDISWVDKSLGLATFRYAYNLVCINSSVNVEVPFTEEQFFNEKDRITPEGSNMMRHILFDHLNRKLNRVAQ